MKETVATSNEKKSSKMSNTKTIEWIVLVVFVLLAVLMYVFHEPWYDEIQAWMVASDASFYDMIFTLPHYEGHPPVWTCLLALFAKIGVPMEIGLRIPTLVFSSIAVYFILFKAPFKRWIRLCIPFNYFLFYQYTVICRPYSMMFLGFVLAGYFYKERNQKPIRYLLSLFLLCVSSAYGILFAGMLCVIWTVEIICELTKNRLWKKVHRDRRFWSLWGMLLSSLGVLAMVWPAENAFAQIRVVSFSALRCLIYTFFVLPADALVSDVALMGRLQQYDKIVGFDYPTILCVVISVLLYMVVITFLHVYKKKSLFLFPYIVFATYAALGYFFNHHIGILPLFLLFVFWCVFADKTEAVQLPKWLNKLEEKNQGLLKKIGYFFVILILFVPMFWSIIAVKNDIQYAAWYAKDLAAMIKEYHLNEYDVINQWTYVEVEDSNAEDNLDGISEAEEGQLISTEIPQLKAEDYYQYVKMCNFVDILAYSDEEENYIYNFNDGNPNNRYVNHDMLSQEESLEYLQELGQKGYPEVIIGDPEVLGMMGLDVNEYRYIPVYSFICYRINKYNAVYANSYVYVREDVYVTRTDWPVFEQIANGFQ